MPGLTRAAVRLVISGDTSGQDWSTSLWMVGVDDIGDQAELNTYVAACAAEITSNLDPVFNTIGLATQRAQFVTGYFYAAGLTSASLVSTPAALTVQGVGSTGSLPPQVAVVASLRSNTPGRSGRGRNYLPMNRAAAMGDDGQLGASTPGVVATNYAAMISDLNDIAYSVANTPVASIASFTKGASYPITRVVVDSIADTQRRREGGMTASVTASENIA